MNTHPKEYKDITLGIPHPVRRTTQTTATSATTESRLIRLVAYESTETINTKKSRQTKPTTTENPLTRQEIYTSTATTENPLKQQIILLSPAATTQKPLTQAEGYAITISTTESPLTRLVEYTTTSPSPITSLKLKQPLTTTVGKLSQVEESPDDDSVQVLMTSKQPVESTVLYAEKSEESELTTTEMPVHWLSTTKTPLSITELAHKQHLEYKTTSLVESEPKTTTTENPLLNYKTTHVAHSTESEEIKFRTENPQTEDQPTQQHMLIYGKQSSMKTADLVTRPTLEKGTDSSVSWSTNASTSLFERDDISNHPKITTLKLLTSSSDSTGDESRNLPINYVTTPITVFTGSSPSTINDLSASTATNDNITFHSSNATIKVNVVDRSTTSATITTDTTVKESTISTNLLTSSSSAGPRVQHIFMLISSNASADSTTDSTTTSITGVNITDSSVSVTGDLLSQSTTTIHLKNISSISTTTDKLVHTAVTGGTTTSIANTTAITNVTLSVMSTQYSPSASSETTKPAPIDKSQKIIANATVEPG
jgi:hypothetical protein